MVERLKISAFGPVLIPLRFVLLLGCSLAAVLFCKLALVGFADTRKLVLDKESGKEISVLLPDEAPLGFVRR